MPTAIIQRINKQFSNTEKEIRSSGLATEQQQELIDKAKKILFGRYDHHLDKSFNEPYWLSQEKVAALVFESLLFFNNSLIDLHCFCIMSNHVHALFTPLADAPPLYNIMRRIKSYTGKYCNELLSLTGNFWEKESYDHIIRNETEFKNVISYVLNNPVKAGLIKDWREWRWSWFSPKLSHFL